MRIKAMLQTAAVLGLAVVAGLVGVSGTWALWSSSAAADAGTVQAANLVVDVNGDRMFTDGTSATVTLADPGRALTPNTPVELTVTLANQSDAGAGLDLRATLGTATIESDNAALPAAIAVQSAVGSCDAATEFGPTATAAIGQGAAQDFCVRLSLPTSAPATLAQSEATVAIPVDVVQIAQ